MKMLLPPELEIVVSDIVTAEIKLIKKIKRIGKTSFFLISF